MGKSPGKWIKTVIFGKKSSKSSSQKLLKRGFMSKKAATLEKEEAVATKALAIVATGESSHNGTNDTLVDEILPFSLPEKQTSNRDKITTEQQEHAAITAQAILRGYLARRSFRAMKGIVRLQALIRGHLVRRQAASTLRYTQGIVRLQALSRGRKVRLSDAGREVQRKFGSLGLSGFSAVPRQDKLSSNTFSNKLLPSSQTAKPLLLRYDPEEPNSAWQWVARWSSSKFWEPLSQKKNIVGTKTNKKGNLQPKKTELSRLKQVTGRISTLNNRKLLSDFIHEKQITSPRTSEAKEESARQEQPLNELERVKRNLKRISASSKLSLGSSESVIETPKLTPKIVSSSPTSSAPEKSADKSLEKSSYSPVAVFEKFIQPQLEISPTIGTIEEKIDKPNDDTVAVVRHPMKIVEEIEDETKQEEDKISKEDKTIVRSYKRNIPTRLDFAENFPQKSPTLPNYMLATQSAKAKLRGFSSPRFEQDEVENGGFLRRHSLPLFNNGKSSFMSSLSERLIARGESRSLLSSANGRGSRPGWKR